MQSFFRSLLLTLIYSWSFALTFIILGGSLYSSTFVIFYIIYNWIPAVVAFQFFNAEKMHSPIKWQYSIHHLWAAIGAISLALFTSLLALPFTQVRSIELLRSYLPHFFTHLTSFTVFLLYALIVLVGSIVVGCTICLIPSLGTELYWRGYCWNKMKTIGFWKASFMIGFFNGVWKMPLVLMGFSYPGYPLMGIFWKIVFSSALSPILVYYRLKTQSVLGPAFFFGVFLAFNELVPLLFMTSHSLITASQGCLGLISCSLFNLLLFLKIRKDPLLEYEL